MADIPTDLEELLARVHRGRELAFEGYPPGAVALSDQCVAHVRDTAADHGLDLDDPFVAAAVLRTLAVSTRLGIDMVDDAATTTGAARASDDRIMFAWAQAVVAGRLMMAAADALHRQGVDGG